MSMCRCVYIYIYMYIVSLSLSLHIYIYIYMSTVAVPTRYSCQRSLYPPDTASFYNPFKLGSHVHGPAGRFSLGGGRARARSHISITRAQMIAGIVR